MVINGDGNGITIPGVVHMHLLDIDDFMHIATPCVPII